jgi:hypothetical protein
MATDLDVPESRTHTLLTAPEDDAAEKGQATGTAAVDESTILTGKKLAIVFVAMRVSTPSPFIATKPIF